MRRNWLAVTAALAVVAVGAFEFGRRSGRASAQREETPVAEAEGRNRIVAMARLEPGSELIRVAAAVPDVLNELLVREGDSVEAGQELAYLESRKLRLLEERAAQLSEEQARLRPLEVESQQARLRQAESQLEHARDEVKRIEGLLGRGLVSEQEYDEVAFRARGAEEDLVQARTALTQAEKTATLALQEAENALELARRQLELTVVRAPIAGRVLRVLAHRGERVVGPLLEMGETGSMYAVAEVHSTEIQLVKPGQSASFSALALDTPLEGVVESVGMMVNYRNIFGEDAAAVSNAKVFEVRVRMEASEQAERFSNLDGQLRIHLGSEAGPETGGDA